MKYSLSFPSLPCEAQHCLVDNTVQESGCGAFLMSQKDREPAVSDSMDFLLQVAPALVAEVGARAVEFAGLLRGRQAVCLIANSGSGSGHT